MTAPSNSQGIASRPILIHSGPITVSTAYQVHMACAMARNACRIPRNHNLTCCSQISIPVPPTGDEWIVAEVLRDQFVADRKTQDTIDTTAQLENDTEASVELFALFLRYIAEKLDSEPHSTTARTALLLIALKHFTSLYLAEQDVHKATAAFDTDVRKIVLTSYYLAVSTLEQKGVVVPRAPVSALLEAASKGNASIYALFGGQGTNEVYFDELQSLYDTYKPFVAPFIAAITTNVLLPLTTAYASTNYFAYGLDVLSWLTGSAERPPVAYLASVPISYPLIALTQLVQYLVVCRAANLTPGELRKRLSGRQRVTGESSQFFSTSA